MNYIPSLICIFFLLAISLWMWSQQRKEQKAHDAYMAKYRARYAALNEEIRKVGTLDPESRLRVLDYIERKANKLEVERQEDLKQFK